MRDQTEAGRRRFLRGRKVSRELAGGDGAVVVESAVAARRRDRSMVRK
jgi:hypothetical protein